MPVVTMASSATGRLRHRFAALLSTVTIAAVTIATAVAAPSAVASTETTAPSAAAGIHPSDGAQAGGNQLMASKGWQSWLPVGSGATVSPGSTITAVWRSGFTHLDLFAAGSDGTVLSTWWE